MCIQGRGELSLTKERTCSNGRGIIAHHPVYAILDGGRSGGGGCLATAVPLLSASSKQLACKLRLTHRLTVVSHGTYGRHDGRWIRRLRSVSDCHSLYLPSLIGRMV